MTTTNEQPVAVALHYDGENPPQVSAKGYGALAQEIINIARENNIPLQENNELVQWLSKLELGDEIPEALYIAIAEIIAFAYYLQGKLPASAKGNEIM